jgi:predicted dehydrogenase
MSVRAVEEMVRATREPKRKDGVGTSGTTDPHVRHLEAELQRLLGTSVRVHILRGEAGRIEIPFYGTDDFERVTELLLGPEAARL